MKIRLLLLAGLMSCLGSLQVSALEITTGSLPDGQIDVDYPAILSTTGGIPPYIWAVVSGSLPDDLSIDSLTGKISGTPTREGTFSFTVSVADFGSPIPRISTKRFSITIASASALEITTNSLSDGEFDVNYSARLSTTGGIPPYTWSIVAGSLPDGLSLNSLTGKISGTPTREGNFSFTVSVADSGSPIPRISTKGFSITITSALEIITIGSLPDGQLDVNYPARLSTTGGIPPYTWSIVSGSLPDGLSLNSLTGKISGTPTREGNFSFTVSVADSGSPIPQSSTQPLSITVRAALIQKLAKRLDSRVKLLTSAIVQQPIESLLNVNNNLGINRYQVELELRVDMDLKFRWLELGLKPRGKFNWKRWDDGIREGEVQDNQDLFINEWLANYMLGESLFISYGRENLQWGPSYLCSPSNPFGTDNGRNNPKQELAGSDFAQILWMPDYRWAFLLVANTDEGRRESPFSDFKKTYALKVDWTGQRKYFSLIASRREGDRLSKFGFFGNWTASDALLVYGEGSFLERGDNPRLLAGASYTLEVGPTITTEYFYNEGGRKEDPIHLCFPPSDPTDVFFRQNYVLVQYVDTCLRDKMYMTLRWILNLDDKSDILAGIVEYGLGDHTQLFTVGNFNVGEEDSEFGSVLSYSVMVGLTFSN